MKTKLLSYRVVSEMDYIDEDLNEKIETYIDIDIWIEEDINWIIPPIRRSIVVINDNSQTGKEMDIQRQKECLDFIASNF